MERPCAESQQKNLAKVVKIGFPSNLPHEGAEDPVEYEALAGNLKNQLQPQGPWRICWPRRSLSPIGAVMKRGGPRTLGVLVAGRHGAGSCGARPPEDGSRCDIFGPPPQADARKTHPKPAPRRAARATSRQRTSSAALSIRRDCVRGVTPVHTRPVIANVNKRRRINKTMCRCIVLLYRFLRGHVKSGSVSVPASGRTRPTPGGSRREHVARTFG